MTDIGDVCDFCIDGECDCMMCPIGNPCLNCEDYDKVNDICKSNGGCAPGKENRMSELIDRQAVIDALDKQIQQCRKALGSLSLSDVDKHAVEVKMASLRAYRKMLENLPTIQPEPQEGHWIDKGCNGDWAWQIDGRGNCWRVIECSECGKRVLVESNYCPNCGAKMTISK